MTKFNYRDAYDAYRYGMTPIQKSRDFYKDSVVLGKVSSISTDANDGLEFSCELCCDASEITKEINNGQYIKFNKRTSRLFKGHSKNELYIRNKELIKRVIFNEPYTIVVWVSGEKTIVKAQDGEPYDKEKGLAMCFAKYFLGNTCRYFDFFKEVCGEEEESKPTVLQKIKAREKKMRKEWGDKDE